MNHHPTAHTFHPDTPHVEIKDDGQMAEGSPRVTSLDMEKVEGYKMFMPPPSRSRKKKVLNDLDLDRESIDSLDEHFTHLHQNNDDENHQDDNDDYYHNDDDDDYGSAPPTRESMTGDGNLTARQRGYTPRSPKKVVRISAREKKTFNNWKKYEKMYEEDRQNNVNPCFMSSMCEYDDPWSRECKQKKKAKENFVCPNNKPFVVTPHHSAVAKRDWQAAQTSVTARGPYVPPHEAHRRFFYDRRKWLQGPWHIPAPNGSFTMRGSAFAAGAATIKGETTKKIKKKTMATNSRSKSRSPRAGRSPRASGRSRR